jgi:hypothetical protein
MPPSVTRTTVVAAKLASESPTCDMCSHPRELHDVIAARYCAASASSALSRGCVCKVAIPAAS